MSIEKYYNSNYSRMLIEWQQLEDCYNENIKAKSTEYLPKTSGMIRDTENGQDRYDAYLRRSNYFNHVKETVTNSKNAINRKPVTIENLPPDMEYLKESFNSDNESIKNVLDTIYKEQMKLGRIGYLVDLIEESGRFEVVKYRAQSILDWNFKRVEGIKQLSFVLLNEDVEELDPQGVSEIEVKQRILGLDSNNNYFTVLLDKNQFESIGDFKVDVDNAVENFEVVYPTYKGKKLNYIPFRVANTDNLSMEYQQAPLLNQSNLSIGVYNADANHQALVYLQTANMLFFKGIGKEDIGNFLGIDSLFHTENIEADAKYVGVDGEGLFESRENLNELKMETGSFGVTVMEKTTQESEKSLQSRIQLQTDKLRDVSLTGAKLVQFLLNTIADWSKKATDIIVTGNTDFRTEQEKASQLKEINEVWSTGGLADIDYYKWQVSNLYTTLEFKEWQKEINRSVTNDSDKTLNDE